MEEKIWAEILILCEKAGWSHEEFTKLIAQWSDKFETSQNLLDYLKDCYERKISCCKISE